ncbi:CerR family C-terminal domain-containing protein [Rhizobium sp. Root482]|jgi:AcrR family transcriptional regulator|uniref:CerR family C-terminal domain-containing protein n=1 Tax=Rhizobium sp. Root482 TaxID=1736543 RepID=UPI0006FADA73|nr:CerR family C-terminal domain-containing protein [Rhizobium sp. Root482]KQY12738.1 TetR family transcriptional regulator [Rhizobium sp. Root482]
MIKDEPTSTTPRSDPSRKEKLLAASLDIFGRYGFDGTSTRQLADAAGVNLQAIPYYFGGKDGLYIATADHLVSLIEAHVGEMRRQMGARLAALDAAGESLASTEARLLLTGIARTMITLFVSKQSEAWARFIIREQMEPTEAFERIYQGIMAPMIGIVRRLVAAILEADPASEPVRLRALSFVGGILVFRVAHAAILAQMEWETVGPRQLETLHDLAADLVAALEPTKGPAA